MLTKTVEKVAKQVLDELVFNNKSFSAYDVTLEVRQRTSERAMHQDIRDYVHDRMDKEVHNVGSYERLQHPMHACWLYQSTNMIQKPKNPVVSPHINIKVDTKPLKVVTLPKAGSPVFIDPIKLSPVAKRDFLTTPQCLDDINTKRNQSVKAAYCDGELKVGSRNRLLVTKELVQHCGAYHFGDMTGILLNVYETNKPQTAILTGKPTSLIMNVRLGRLWGAYQPDYHNTVKLAANSLSRCGINVKQGDKVKYRKLSNQAVELFI